ncbi:NAD-dependent epimerase/dehydratase family protein, partial [Kocuria marina]|uniref:NAD-dependent epimerase/dehydratase family protein n=1 Tax=Kocuria marina TaxID=223184 RepID=UPI002989A1D5
MDRLLELGTSVTILDDLSNPNWAWLEAQRGRPDLTIIEGSCTDPAAVDSALVALMDRADRRTAVFHLAANADIRGGVEERGKDLRNTVMGTVQMLEGMTRHGIREFVMASTGAVYGESVKPPFSVTDGPLQPVSLYGAGKVAAEGGLTL